MYLFYFYFKNSQIWKSINIVKGAFALLGWLLFAILIGYDKTYESLEKRDFDLLDDIAVGSTAGPDQKASEEKTVKQLNQIQSVA